MYMHIYIYIHTHTIPPTHIPQSVHMKILYSVWKWVSLPKSVYWHHSGSPFLYNSIKKKKYMPVDGNYPLIRLPSWKWAWLWGPWQFHTHESWSSSGLLMWDKGECEWLESSPKGRTTNRNRAKKLVLAWAWSVSSPSQTNHQFRPTPASRGGI